MRSLKPINPTPAETRSSAAGTAVAAPPDAATSNQTKRGMRAFGRRGFRRTPRRWPARPVLLDPFHRVHLCESVERELTGRDVMLGDTDADLMGIHALNVEPPRGDVLIHEQRV